MNDKKDSTKQIDRKIMRRKRRNLLELIIMSIFCLIVLHITWQLISRAVGADNRITTDIAGRMGLDDELSIPTWFSSMLAAGLAVLAFVVANVQKTAREKFTWYLLAVIGLLVSVDEVSALHELLLQGLHILANFGEGQGYLANAWLIVLPFFAVILLFVARFLHKTLPSKTFWRLAVAVAVYLAGAAVVEYVSITFDKNALSYLLGVVVVEEGLELIGLWLALRAVLLHINTQEPHLRSRLAELLG